MCSPPVKMMPFTPENQKSGTVEKSFSAMQKPK